MNGLTRTTFGIAERFLLGLNEQGLAVLGGLAVLVTIIALAFAFVPDDAMAARARSHVHRRERLRTQRVQSPRRTPLLGRQQIGSLRQILDRLKLLSGEEARRCGELLSNAGWRARDALTIYMGLRLALPLVFGTITLLALLTDAGMPPLYRLLGTSFAAVAGAYAPTLVLRRFIAARQGHIRKQLPDGLDLLVICAEAGLSLDAALTRVAREMGGAAPQLADELGLTAVELGFLPNRRQALHNLARRTNLPSIRGVVNTLIQTERYGTPLASSLRVLANEFRDERLLKAEEKAARLPATLTVPMIVFILPTLFVVLMGPAIIQVLAHFHH